MGVVGFPFSRWRLDIARLERFLPRRVTRRHVIGGALVAGAGVTGLRLLAAERGAPRSAGRSAARAAAAAAPAVSWAAPLEREAARISHLLRRATFGGTPDEME